MRSQDFIDSLAEDFDPEEIEQVAATPQDPHQRILDMIQDMVVRAEWRTPHDLDCVIPHRIGNRVSQLLKAIDPQVSGMSLDYRGPVRDEGFAVRFFFPSLLYGAVRAHNAIRGRVQPPRPA